MGVNSTNSWLFLPSGHCCETCRPLPSQPRSEGVMQLISSCMRKAQRAPCCAGPPAPVLGYGCLQAGSPPGLCKARVTPMGTSILIQGAEIPPGHVPLPGADPTTRALETQSTPSKINTLLPVT